MTAAYGLVNANAKWQHQSDVLMLSLGCSQLSEIPPLLYRNCDEKMVLTAAKIVDDMDITGEMDAVDYFIKKLNEKFELGTVAHGPGRPRFFGMNIAQKENYSCYIDADDKLGALAPCPITHVRRKQTTDELSAVDRSLFMSLNSSLGGLVLAASPFCAFYASHLQQKLPDATISAPVQQRSRLKQLQVFGTRAKFTRPSAETLTVNAAIATDDGRQNDYRQLSYLSGILSGPLAEDSTFHTLSWVSHKSRMPARTIAATEFLAASEAIDEGKTLEAALSTFLNIAVKLIIIVDSTDLHTSLCALWNSIDRSIIAGLFDLSMKLVTSMKWFGFLGL